MEKNPYAAPRAHVDDVADAQRSDYVPEGIARPIGRGFSWVADGFRTFFQSPGTWILIGFLYVLIFIVLQYGPMLLFGASGSLNAMVIGVGIGSIALVLLFSVFNAGIMHGCHALANGEPLRVGHLFSGFSANPGRLVLMGVLYFIGFVIIMVIVGLLTGGFMPMLMTMAGAGMGGAQAAQPSLLPILVLLALTLPLIMAIWFAPALISINDEPTVRGMLSSFKGCLKNILPFLVYGIAMLVVIFVFALIFGLIVGLLVALVIRPEMGGSTAIIVGMLSGIIMGLLFGLIVLPVVMGSMYGSYRDIYYE